MLTPHHDGSSLYVSNAAPALGDTVELRVRVPKGYDFDKAVVRFHHDGEPRTAEMTKQSQSDVESWWHVDMQVLNRSTRYRFLFAGKGRFDWLNAEGLHDHDVHSNTDFQLVARPAYPKWLTSSVFYQIFPDRFASSGPKALPAWARAADWTAASVDASNLDGQDVCGGDLKGVEEKLPYLTDLGVNGIYFTPVFPAQSNHRYDASSFDTVDPLLGGDEAWNSLRAAAASAGVRLVGDITTNHCGAGHEWMARAKADEDSVEHDFFYWTDAFDWGYVAWWDFKSLPKLNFASFELRDRLYAGNDSVIRTWVGPRYGLSGWRIDVGNMTGRLGEIDMHDEVMHGIRQAMDEVAPDAWLVAENGDFEASDLAGEGWHGTMNYQGFMRPIASWMNRDAKLSGGFQGLPVDSPIITGTQLVNTMRAFSAAMPWRALVASMVLLDSHDTPRFRTIVAGDRHRHLAAMTMLMTFPGVPSIFMGDELGLGGTGLDDARRTIDWDRPEQWDNEFRAEVRELIALRRTESALIDGGLRWVASGDRFVCYLRESPGGAVLVLVACNACEVDIDLSVYGYEVAETLFGDATLTGSRITLQLPDATSFVWRLK